MSDEKKIWKLTYNWHQTNWDGTAGEDYSQHIVGENNVTEIIEHPSQTDGDKWFCYVRFSDGSEQRIFNPNQVFIK